LAEAANAWRTRRTRGETGLRRFFWAVFFGLGLAAEALCGTAFAGFASDFVSDFGDDVEDAGGVDWATAEFNQPSSKKKNVPARTKTAKRRTSHPTYILKLELVPF
jgi:hypothetical protein